MTRQSTDLEDELESELELEDEYEFESEFEDEYEGELEDEYEDESELEDEAEDEDFLPALGGIANAIGGLLGEEEYEDEDEQFLGALGGIARTVGGLLGGGDGEEELEFEGEDEAEEFVKGLGGLFRKALPVLRTIAKTAGPLVATAVGGPAAGALARAVTSQLEGEGEEEAELEDLATAPLTGAQALGEYLAAQAATAESEAEAEAMVGVATYVSLGRRERRDLERMIPALLRGAAVLTRLLHGDRRTRTAIRLVPGIVNGAARTALRGADVDPAQLGGALGRAIGRTLGPGRARTALLRRHARGVAHARRRYRRGHRGYRGYRGYRPHTQTIRRQPVRTRTQAGRAVARPGPGFVRVVTPVRVPARGGRPARTVRMVSDVRVPSGAVAAGRPTAVASRRRGR